MTQEAIQSGWDEVSTCWLDCWTLKLIVIALNFINILSNSIQRYLAECLLTGNYELSQNWPKGCKHLWKVSCKESRLRVLKPILFNAKLVDRSYIHIDVIRLKSTRSSKSFMKIFDWFYFKNLLHYDMTRIWHVVFSLFNFLFLPLVSTCLISFYSFLFPLKLTPYSNINITF